MDEIEALRSSAGLIALAADGTTSELKNTPFMASARRS